MSIIKRAGDLVYTFRFLKLLVTPFEDTEAYKRGIIDKDGKRIKSYELSSQENRDAYKSFYTPFHRLVYNIKRLIPAGKLGSYAAALYLIKENFGISEKKILQALSEAGVEPKDILAENSQWFILDDGRLTPGDYRIASDKVLNETCDDAVYARDIVRVGADAYPVGQFYGINIYEVTHTKTRKSVYVTAEELRR
jgi:hypothetical protein